MTPGDALKRLSDDDWYAHLQSDLTRVEELIDDAQARVAEHAAHIATFEKSAPELHAVSRELQRNLEEGLRLLLHQRGLLVRELASIERRKNVALGLYFRLGKADGSPTPISWSPTA
jgi:chromosome segregation ATPase